MSVISSALGFTMDELSLNRAGRLSSRQLWESIQLGLWPIGMFLVLVVMLLSFVLWTKPSGAGKVLYAMPLAGMALMAYLTWYFMSAAWVHRVLIVDGELSFQERRGGPAVIVGGIWLQNPPQGAPSVLNPGDRYRLYYVGTSKMFLSIEPLP